MQRDFKESMSLFDDLFYFRPMLEVFSDRSRVRQMLRFEAALACAEADLGLIPQQAAEDIASVCATTEIDLEALTRDAALAGNLAIPAIKQLVQQVSRRAPEAGRFVHWGATSQDAIDTGFMLQASAGLDLLDELVDEVCEALRVLVEQHADTVMAGRTWLQHAVPITFGWKTAGWLDAMLRHKTRLTELRGRALTLQFGGAAGTLASLGDKGWEIAERISLRLHLQQADIAWHGSRDRMAEMATVLGLLTGTLGKIAQDLILLMQTEVGEVAEAAAAGGGGSSTMPQKRNPVGCSAVLAAAARTPGLVATALNSMLQQHERGLGGWQAEWEVLPELFNFSAGALARMAKVLTGLEIDVCRMKQNLELSQGLIMAEAISMKLGERLGKPEAHALVERACKQAVTQGRSLRDTLLADSSFGVSMTAAELDGCLDPMNSLGVSRRAVCEVLARTPQGGPSAYLQLPEVNLHFSFTGRDKALPVLILANSLGTDLSLWDSQVAVFSRHFRVLRFDGRGHGRSSVPAGPYRLPELGADLVALMDDLAIGRAHFCGISLGGALGQWLGIHAPARLERLVLANTAARIGMPDRWAQRVAIVLESGMGGILPGVLNGWFTADFQQQHPQVRLRFERMLARCNASGYASTCAALEHLDLRGSVGAITAPTLVLSGSHDLATPPAEGQALAGQIRGARYKALNAAHLSNVEAASEFNRTVLAFLLEP